MCFCELKLKIKGFQNFQKKISILSHIETELHAIFSWVELIWILLYWIVCRAIKMILLIKCRRIKAVYRISCGLLDFFALNLQHIASHVSWRQRPVLWAIQVGSSKAINGKRIQKMFNIWYRKKNSIQLISKSILPTAWSRSSGKRHWTLKLNRFR